MKVKALCNLLYKQEIYNIGNEFEMDAEKAKYWEQRGGVKILNGTVETDFTPAEGLPDLISQNTGKKKK